MAASQSLLIKWTLPMSPQQCGKRNHSIACNFELYSNSSTLTETQKLAPNNDFAGNAIIEAFIVSNVIALLFSAVLLWDRFQWHFLIHNCSNRRLYLRAIHVSQRLLHALSDHQLVAGLALLVTLNNQACSIYAYNYNIACTMLILSAVTHLNSLLSIQEYIHKGRAVAGIRIVAIVMQYIFSAIVLSGRNAKTGFPTNPGSLGIMPAPCFLNMNASSYWGFGDAIDAVENVTMATFGPGNTTANSTTIGNGTTNVATLAILGILYACRSEKSSPAKSELIGLFGMCLSASSILASICVVVIAYMNYSHLRSGMEVSAWYQLTVAARQTWSYSQFVTIFLVASASLHGVSAVTESLLGHKGRRFVSEAYKKLDEEVTRYEEEMQ